MPKYIVNLPVQVEAENVTEAVNEFMQTILKYGLRPWSYQVVSGEGTVIADGEGAVIEDVKKDVEEADESEEAQDEPSEADGPSTEPE